MMRRFAILLVAGFATSLFAARPTIVMPADDVNAPNVLPKILKGLGFHQKLKESVPLDLKLKDESGNVVRLGKYFHGRPVILSLVYYGCPNICQFSIGSVFKSLHKFEYQVGRDFEFVFVSIDPTEGPKLAAEKKAEFTHKSTVVNAENGIHFLTGDDAAIKKLSDSVGFYFQYEPSTKQYAHPSGVIAISPDGKISSYLYGIDYPRKDLRLAIVQASENKVGSAVDRFLLFCYHYDPAMGRFGLFIVNLLKISGLATVALLAMLILWLRKREPKNEKLLVS